MKRYKKFAWMLLAIVILFIPCQALAAENIDPTHKCILTISYQDGSVPLTGASFSIYMVATVDEAGALAVTEDFAQYHVALQSGDDAQWRMAASTLEGYVLRDNITPTGSGITDSRGTLSFPTADAKLTPGLYLILGSRHLQDNTVYDAQPLMVMLPTLDKDTNDWCYHVNIHSKYESAPIPPDHAVISRKVLKVWADEEHEKERPAQIEVQLLKDGAVYDTVTLSADNNWRYTWSDLDAHSQWSLVEKVSDGYTVEITREGITFVVINTWEEPDDPTPTEPTSPDPTNPPPPDDPKLPQTGQLWWPVPLLICAGLLFIVAGLVRRRGIADEEEKG